MEAEYQHKVLVVDDDAQIAKTIEKLLETEQLEVVLANSSDSAIKHISEAKKPFSLIISDQRSDGIPGAAGTEFLKQVKDITPDSQRFLLTACSDIDIIINAVNKGSIQRYIRKPWDNTLLLKAIRQGLRQFERCLENDKLLKLAKSQNSKLYNLNCELMETTTAHNKECQVLEKEIEILQDLIDNLISTDQISLDGIIDDIKNHVKNNDGVDNKKIKKLLIETIRILYKQFNEVAARSGFEMPIPKGEIPC